MYRLRLRELTLLLCRKPCNCKNGGQLIGGYGEKELKSYEAVANVTANTNGLKKATKAEDGACNRSKTERN